MNKKLLFRLGLLFGFVLLISAAVIYFTFDIRTLEYLTMFEPRCILLALSCLAIGLIFDGLRLITLASVTDEKLTFHQIVNVVLSNYFLALERRVPAAALSLRLCLCVRPGCLSPNLR